MAAPDDDATVRVSATAPRRPSAGAPAPGGGRLPLVAAVVVAALAGGAATWWLMRPPSPLPGPQPAMAVASVAPAGGSVSKALEVPSPPAPPPGPPAPAAVDIHVADEATILANEPAALTVFRFSLNPAVLVLDFPTLAQQGQMLNRMAVMVEKAGLPHDRLLDDAALDATIRGSGEAPATFYYGHDYRAAELRRFFELAERDHIALDADETWLHGLLVQVGWADPSANGSIISIPRGGFGTPVDMPERAVILHHELSHGEYFTNPAYADYVRRFWSDEMSAKDRATFRAFLGDDHYDTSIEDLMMNETQAYMMHTRDPRFFSAAALHMPQSRLDALRAAFLVDMPHGWLRDCTTGPDPIVPAHAPRVRQGTAISRRKAVAATRPRRRAASMAA